MYVPATLILQPEKVATPEDVLLGFWFPVRTPPTDGRRDDDGDRSPLVVTVLPLAS